MKKKIKKLERIRETQKIFKETLSYYQSEKHGFDKTILQRIDENGAFYHGVQWPEWVKAKLKGEKRPASVINKIAPKVHMISGYERQNRTEVKPLPFESQDDLTAFVMEMVMRHVHRYIDYDFDNSEGFLKGIVTSAAHWEYSVNVGADGYPVIERELLRSSEVMWDPLSVQYDRSDAEYCVHETWIGIEELKKIKPKLDELEIEMAGEESYVEEGILDHIDRYRIHSFKELGPDFFNEKDRKVRLIRLWKRHWDRVWIVRDRETKQIRELDDKEVKEIDIENPTFEVSYRLKPRWSYHEISGNEELVYQEDVGVSRCPVVSFYPYFMEGVFFGVVDLLKDRQIQINKFDSVMIDYLSRLPKLGMIYEDGAFNSPIEERKASNLRVGDSIKTAKGALQKGLIKFPGVHGMEIISYYESLKKAQNEEMKEISGAHDILQGLSPKNAQSGIAFQILKNQGMTVLEPIFDNFGRTKVIMGKLEIELIQKVFPPEKIERIMGAFFQKYKDSRYLQKWEELRNDKEKIESFIDTLMTTDYDIVLDETVSSSTMKHANGMILMNLIQMGIPVPPDLIIESTDLSQDQKDRWKEWLNMQQMSAGSAEGRPGEVQGSGDVSVEEINNMLGGLQ